MATQPVPLSRYTISIHSFGTDALGERPELAAMVAYIITGWSVVETRLGHIFGLLIGASKPATMSMYAAFRSFEVQRTLLETAALDLLSTRYADMFVVVLTVLKRAASIRHQFAHGLWGSAQGMPDALLLAEPKSSWAARIEGIKYERSLGPFKGKILGPAGMIPQDKIMVYDRSVLIHYLKIIEDNYQYVDYLYRMIDLKGARRLQVYRLLCNSHEIRQGLIRRMKGQHRRYRLPSVS